MNEKSDWELVNDGRNKLSCILDWILLQQLKVLDWIEEKIERGHFNDKKGILWRKDRKGNYYCITNCKTCNKKVKSCIYSEALVCNKCFKKTVKENTWRKNENFVLQL